MTKKKAFSLFEMSIIILIIGIIIAGFAATKELIYKSHLSSARTLSNGSVVAQTDGLLVWLDATRKNALTNTNDLTRLKNNDSIKGWLNDINQFGESHNFIGPSGYEPTYLEKGINNLPTLYFNPASDSTGGDFLYVSYSKRLNPTDFTIFIVTRPLEITTNWSTLYINRDASSGNNSYSGSNLYRKPSLSTFELWFGNGSSWKNITGNGFTSENNYILTLSHDSDNTTTSFYNNGVLEGSNSSDSLKPNHNPGDETHKNFYIGAKSLTASSGYDGYISEFIMYDKALDIEERTAVENYLSKKYAIEF